MEDKKILMIIANKDFRDEEYEVPRSIFKNEGVEFKVANSSGEESEGSQGLKVDPDMSIMQVTVSDYDAIVFVGGTGAGQYFSDQTVMQITKDAYKFRKIIAAICIAPLILANAGILEGKNVTASESVKDNLQNFGAIYTDRPVEVDGNIITGRDPEASADFGRAIVQALKIENGK